MRIVRNGGRFRCPETSRARRLVLVTLLCVACTAKRDVPLFGSAAADACQAPKHRALRILFIGNSFTRMGGLPARVRALAAADGWPAPYVALEAERGLELATHRRRPATLAALDRGGWDIVVLQELSIKPTHVGDPAGFVNDATWLYDRALASSPDATVVLFETWPRAHGHAVYDESFTDPHAMLGDVRTAYIEAQTRIPLESIAPVAADVRLALVGDAWERYGEGAGAPSLYGDDLYHAGSAGQALSAAVLYDAIYGCGPP